MFSVVSYLRAGLLLHIITLLEISLLAVLAPKLLLFKTGFQTETIPVNAGIFLFLATLPIFSQLDARSRFQNYKRVKVQFMNFGFDRRLLRPLLKSRCQRDAAQAAADELGYGSRCRAFYNYRGYRWYHLTPDFLFDDPRVLISRQFWKSTFFLPAYPIEKSRLMAKMNTWSKDGH